VKTHLDDSQDTPQTSAPDGKSIFTPLSQTGFRDPASVGCGQQLTLLSIEVLEIVLSFSFQAKTSVASKVPSHQSNFHVGF